MEQFVNVALVTFFIVREVVFRFVPPAAAAFVTFVLIPRAVREKKIRGTSVGDYTFGKVPAIVIIVFALLVVVWHFAIAAHPEWRAGWYTE